MKFIITEQLYHASISSDQWNRELTVNMLERLESEARHSTNAAVPEIQSTDFAVGWREDGDTIPQPHHLCSAGEPRQRSSEHQQDTSSAARA